MNRRVIVGLAALAAIGVVLAILRLMLSRPLAGAIEFGWPDGVILDLRLAAIVSAIVIGTALAVSGTMLQAVLRNPLADPYILGVSSGAGLGVMTAMYLAWAMPEHARWLTAWGTVGPAALGAIAAISLVLALGRRSGEHDPLTLVLAGAVVSAMCGAGIVLLQHLVPHGLRGDLTVWMMGRLPESIDRSIVGSVAAMAVLGVLIGARMGRAMDVATFGDDEAHAVGLHLGRTRIVLVALAGLLAASTVALAGPIAFIGLIAPHAARLLIGARHGPLVVGSALAGAALLLGADCLRQLIDLGSGRLPVGVITALLGGPVFLWLLRSGRGSA